MTPERYRQIDQIFQAALALERDQRAAYLDEVCSGDEKLRQEVESLCQASFPPMRGGVLGRGARVIRSVYNVPGGQRHAARLRVLRSRSRVSE